MPVKKTTTVRAKSKGTAPVKKTTESKDGAVVGKFDDLRDLIVEAIQSGQMDYCLVAIDDAVTLRIEADEKKRAAEAKKKGTTASKEKTVPTPVKKKTEPLVPEVNKPYVIDAGVKTHGGKKGKFLRFYKGDATKSVIDVGEAKPIVVRTASLKKAVGRRPAKK